LRSLNWIAAWGSLKRDIALRPWLFFACMAQKKRTRNARQKSVGSCSFTHALVSRSSSSTCFSRVLRKIATRNCFKVLKCSSLSFSLSLCLSFRSLFASRCLARSTVQERGQQKRFCRKRGKTAKAGENCSSPDFIRLKRPGWIALHFFVLSSLHKSPAYYNFPDCGL
jgi:hypothetical protein